jgi:outer membrane protein assembly factor BamB
MVRCFAVFLCFVLMPSTLTNAAPFTVTTPQYTSNPFIIKLNIPPHSSGEGGIIVAPLVKNGVMDFLVTRPGYIAAYNHDGSKLWIKKTNIRLTRKSEDNGLPGTHSPGIQAGYISSTTQADIVYVDSGGTIHGLDGATGREIWQARPPHPDGAKSWEVAAIANLRGQGERDLILQATNKSGYRLGKFLAAYRIEDLRNGNYTPLWERDDYFSCAHNAIKIADLNGDGRDEIIGGNIISHTGNELFKLPMPQKPKKPHIDSIFIQDVKPGIPGLEVVALEEGAQNRVFLYNADGLIWGTDYKRQEPQNAAVGQFQSGTRSMQVWCRSRYNRDQKPFVFNSEGNLINEYRMNDIKPDGWTNEGVEVINSIDWTGGSAQWIVAKERHKSGDVGLFDGISGQFDIRIEVNADRLFVADVSGDWREEIIVLDGNHLKIYHNAEGNQGGNKPRLWQRPYYQRSKMNHNYYSP